MKRLALCIGNDNYSMLPRLSFCIDDANSVEKHLKDLGFETKVCTDLDREAMADAIIEFAEQIGEYDTVLFYYAGHGFEVDGDNILAPVDLNINARPAAVRMSAFPLSELMNQLNRWPEQSKIIILDACRDTLGYRGSFRFFAPVSAPQGSVIAFSTSPGQSAKENNLTGHGYYTESLLRYISLPRVPVETVFKKVREYLAAATGGTQISWEHTSLIGEVYLNPDTIYDGVSYCWEARADSRFHFNVNSEIKGIVDGLKSLNWPQQEAAINSVSSVNFHEASCNELFVLGRNIYQAVCGNSFACQRFVSNFGVNDSIPMPAKLHILNGMAYEIYYDSNGRLRNRYKNAFLTPIVKYLEQAEFYASRQFIASNLCRINNLPIYIPGQNELIDLYIKGETIGEGYEVKDIIYRGQSILYVEEFDGIGEPYSFGGKGSFEQEISSGLVAPADCVRFQYDNSEMAPDTYIYLSEGNYRLRYVKEGD